MLAPTKPSLTHLIQWLRSHDPNESYNWQDCETCLFAQYAASMGMRTRDGAGYSQMLWAFGVEDTVMIGAGDTGLNPARWTFGQALARAEAIAEARAAKDSGRAAPQPTKQEMPRQLVLELA